MDYTRLSIEKLMEEYIRQSALAEKWKGEPGEISARQEMNAIAERVVYLVEFRHSLASMVETDKLQRRLDGALKTIERYKNKKPIVEIDRCGKSFRFLLATDGCSTVVEKWYRPIWASDTKEAGWYKSDLETFLNESGESREFVNGLLIGSGLHPCCV